MILSNRDIHKRCQVKGAWGKIQQPMIYPYVAEKTVHPCGYSYGLSGASYDLRVAEDVILPANPVYLLANRLRPANMNFNDQHTMLSWLETLRHCPELCQSQLAHTLEWLTIPDDVCAFVVDKSSYARRFVSAMNTLFDPGFQGHGVLELVNLGREPVYIRAGEPICQMVFHRMNSKAMPYSGKYQRQVGTVGSRRERADGSWVEER